MPLLGDWMRILAKFQQFKFDRDNLTPMQAVLENHLATPASPPVIEKPSETGGTERNPSLDIWRGIACLMVFAFHTGASFRWPPFAFYGNNGVHLFFVLSGYLIFQPFLRGMSGSRPMPSVGRFYARRFLRIYPPYLVALAAFILLRYVTHTNAPSAFNILSHALMSFNYVSHINFFSINPVFWSLAIEAQFYLILPIACMTAVALTGSGRAGKQCASLLVVASFLVIGVASRTAENMFRDSADVRVRTIFSYLDLFGWGMLTAYVQQRFRLEGRIVSRWPLVCLGVIIVLATNSWSFYAADGNWLLTSKLAYTVISPALICAGASLILLAIVLPSCPTKHLGILLLPLVWTGEISYSIYLYHVGVQFVIFKLIRLQTLPYMTQAILYALISLPPTLLISWLMYLAIERPSLRWSGSLRRAKRSNNALDAGSSELPESAIVVA